MPFEASPNFQQPVTRRSFLGLSATVAAAGIFRSGSAVVQAAEPKAAEAKAGARRPTEFLHACMTLPYSEFPLARALVGIKAAGYRYVAWGTRHREGNGQQLPVMADDAPPEKAKELGQRCRDLGL